LQQKNSQKKFKYLEGQVFIEQISVSNAQKSTFCNIVTLQKMVFEIRILQKYHIPETKD